MCIDFSVSTKKLLTMYIDFCVIVIQPINIGEQERQGMMFTTTTRAKNLNGLRYEKMTNLTRVTIRMVEETSLRLIRMKTICNSQHSYYSHFLSFNTIIITLNSKFVFHLFSSLNLLTIFIISTN